MQPVSTRPGLTKHFLENGLVRKYNRYQHAQSQDDAHQHVKITSVKGYGYQRACVGGSSTSDFDALVLGRECDAPGSVQLVQQPSPEIRGLALS